MMHYAAANRDPEAFPSPDEFSLDRERNRHLSFGLGNHAPVAGRAGGAVDAGWMRTLLQRCPICGFWTTASESPRSSCGAGDACRSRGR